MDEMLARGSFIERFETKEHCASLACDFTTSWLDNKMLEEELVEDLFTITDLYFLFERIGYKVKCSCSRVFLLNPILLLLVLISNFKHKKRRETKKYVIVYFSSAFYFYGINALWNHYVVEGHDNNNIVIYDSYYQNISDDYADIDCKPLKVKDLHKIRAFKIHVWKE